GLDSQGRSWLPARLCEDGDCWRIVDAGTARLLRRNLGTILAERTLTVALFSREAEEPEERGGSIGELDEAFAERLQPGDRFLLDGRCLEYRRREEQTILVDEGPGRARVQRWGGEGLPPSPQLARRLYVLRIRAAEALREGPGALAELLCRDYELEGAAVTDLVDHFQRQERISEIPDLQ